MTAPQRKLSSKEVAALVGGLTAHQRDAEPGPGGADVRPYAFGSNDVALLGEYHALSMINERFCRIARSVFVPMLRLQPRISAFPAELRSFDAYRNGQDTFVSLTNTRIEELRGNCLMVIPPGLISVLTNAYYGGSIRALKPVDRHEFTATEHRVIEIVTDRLNQSLQLAWRDLMALTLTVISREENMQFAPFVDGDDMVVTCSFQVQLPEMEPAGFDILYPLQALKPISSQLRSRMQSDFLDEDQSWRERLERAVLSIPLPVTALLCEPQIPLRDLMALTEGALIPATLTETVRVLVEGTPLFEARAGEVAGRSAISVTKRLKT
jgi:flagellar motor switch protein FliM